MAKFDNLAWVQAKGEEARMRLEVANATIRGGLPLVYLPLSEGDRAVAPSPLLWGSLFSVLPRLKRTNLKNARLGQSGDLVLRFTGERLGQDDLDVFLVLIRLTQNLPLGTPVKITGASLLNALGLTDTGGQGGVTGGDGSRDRIEASLRRLTSSFIELRGCRGNVFMGHLLESARRGHLGEAWTVVLSPCLGQAFAAGFAGVDLRLRRQLRNKPMAGWLHAWLAAHGWNPHPHRVSLLRELTGSNSTPSEFKRLLTRALKSLDDALKDTGEVGVTWTINFGCLRICRSGSKQKVSPPRRTFLRAPP